MTSLIIFHTGNEYAPQYIIVGGNYQDLNKLDMTNIDKNNLTNPQKAFLSEMYYSTGKFSYSLYNANPILRGLNPDCIITINITKKLLINKN